MRRIALLFSVLCLLLAGCGRTTGQIPSDPPQGSSAADQAPQETASGTAQSEIFPDDEIPSSSKPSGGSLPADAEIDQDAALALAMEKAGVPEKDTYNVKVERDRENDIPIFQVEFETEYGNYDFEIAITGGKIIGADYEVDEEWLDRLGGSPVTLEEAKQVVCPAPARKTSGCGKKATTAGADLRENYTTTASNMSLRSIQRPELFLTGMRICGSNRPAQSWFE